MNPEDRALIVSIGQAARTCAMYRELLEVVRRYQHQDEISRLTQSLADADAVLAALISKALEDDVRPDRPAAAAPAEGAGSAEPGEGTDDAGPAEPDGDTPQ